MGGLMASAAGALRKGAEAIGRVCPRGGAACTKGTEGASTAEWQISQVEQVFA